MAVAAIKTPFLERSKDGAWLLRQWVDSHIVAGITDRSANTSCVMSSLRAIATVEAEQVHGAGIAMVNSAEGPLMLNGCDALFTSMHGTALIIRTADCLPIFFANPLQKAIGIAHVGWRGIISNLPSRMVAAFRHNLRTDPANLYVAIGPAIHECCYEVDKGFSSKFGFFVKERNHRFTCDLVGLASEQLRFCGVRQDRIFDTGCCTACDLGRWFSFRKEGSSTGRMASFIMLRP